MMLTLSIPNDHDLARGLKRLRNTWAKFLKHWYIRKICLGGFYVVEITKSQTYGWHPHIHAVVYTKFFMYALLKQIWNELVSGSADGYANSEMHEITDIGRAASYITKYLTKVEFPLEEIGYVNKCLRNKRLFMTWGAFRVKARTVCDSLCACAQCGCAKAFESMGIRWFLIPDTRSGVYPLSPSDYPGLPPPVIDVVNDVHMRIQREVNIAACRKLRRSQKAA